MRITIRVLLSIALGLLAGCGTGMPVPKVSGPSILLVFVDQSDSINAQQREQWLGEAGAIVKRLRSGAFLYVYGIHDHTSDAAPRFVPIPELPEEPLPEQYQAWEKARNEAMADLVAAMDTDSPSHATDIFSAFDRCADAAQGRGIKIVIFSDMLNVTKDMNMEKQPLLDGDFTRIISRLGQQHRWSSGTLRGAPVFVVLPSVEKTAFKQVSSQPPANDRLVLRQFYDTLITTLGGKLVCFNTSGSECPNLQPGSHQ